MCGGFITSFILIGVGGYTKAAGVVTSITVAGGLIACGILLFLIAVLGIVGAIKHSQVLLFFYMVILFILFIVQFSIAIASLSTSTEKQNFIIEQGWNSSSEVIKGDAQKIFQCCGFHSVKEEHPSCVGIKSCCSNRTENCCSGDYTCEPGCQSCFDKIKDSLSYAFHLTGGIGLFFSFTEIFGFLLTYHYRNLLNPKANPNSLF